MDTAAIGAEGGLSAYRILQYAGPDLPLGDVRGFIYSNWLRSLRHSNDFFKLIDPPAYWNTYKNVITNLLSSPKTVVRLAVLEDDHDVLLGFAVYRGPILDYVYVHRHQRLNGIGSKLVPSGIGTITHLTKIGLSIWGSKHGSWKFNPFA